MHDGDMNARADVTTRDEIGTLGRSFNDMADKLGDTIQSLREEQDSLRSFLADASHELRTPLAAMSTFVELLQREPETKDQRELLEDMESQTRRMSRTVSDLLLLSRLDGGVTALERDRHQAAAILREAWDNVSRSARAQGVTFSVTVDEAGDEDTDEMAIYVDRSRAVTLFENLLENSINSMDGSGSVDCRLSVSDGDCVVRVIDDGPGIAAEDLPHVFERFFRPANARTDGSGLGLSIAQSVARAHGGSIAVRSPVPETGSGTEMRVTLPLGDRS
jgi:two-component system sensor histidine kinase MtrB